ncbi:hypothetical protein [Halobacillus salinus]|uniref:Uncharacterized protein n=1 Tax=Halobacillus salinus TaxID=192814 RepID=A0A4Z0GWF6_9BACI|nr:hypothetical protein [Halobacillus salinus]TGB00764.1 hypothetical protein E4663_19305 [Halobacillus salinus]
MLYKAVTYDVCEHQDLYQDMNDYTIDFAGDVEGQIRKLAKQDIAPVVKLYESETSDFKEFRLYEEYRFIEYECDCK